MLQALRKLQCHKLSREGQTTAVYDPSSLCSVLPQADKCHNNSVLSIHYALFQTRTESEEQPINISESKPRCFPLNNESGTFGPSQGETVSKNCSLVESYV